jgi:orotidine-5'-phosphate decarboxylase
MPHERSSAAAGHLAGPQTPGFEEARKRLVFPLDYGSLDEARPRTLEIAQAVGVLKIGLELFVREGAPAVSFGRSLGLDVFLDLKLHDIPETVARAVRAAAALGARYITVHAAGGTAMLRRAVTEAEGADSPLTVLAVTVLTSLDAEDLAAQGTPVSPRDQVLRLARLAWDAGVRGFVASPAEAAPLRAALGPDALIVTPGIRPAKSDAFDQKRIATPTQAIADGADLLVVGRPIRDAEDPLAAAVAVVEEIREAAGLGGRTTHAARPRS